jgi:hypothetical protein
MPGSPAACHCCSLHAQILLGYTDTESGGVIDDYVLLSRSELLYYTLLSITNWFRRFSARRAERCAGVACSEFYKTIRSASWTAGQDRRYHSSHTELPPRPCAVSFATLDSAPRSPNRHTPKICANSNCSACKITSRYMSPRDWRLADFS